jgi:hypothetical protein
MRQAIDLLKDCARVLAGILRDDAPDMSEVSELWLEVRDYIEGDNPENN